MAKSDATNYRINEKALSTKDLYSSTHLGEDSVVPIDDEFLATALTWVKNGQDLAESGLELLGTPNSDGTEGGLDLEKTASLDTDPHSPSNEPFTPLPKDTGGRPTKPSPIRPRRTYRAVLKSPPPLDSSPESVLSDSPIVFRNYRKNRATKQSIAPLAVSKVKATGKPLTQRPLHTKSKAKAADLNDVAALEAEDSERIAGNFDSWSDPWYQLRIEEANWLSDMLTQMSLTLDLGTLVLADQGNNLKFFLDKAAEQGASTLDELLVSRHETVVKHDLIAVSRLL
jgi:hypothetical protein